MSSTESLRNDHFLIERMVRALNTTADLLQAGKSIPAPFLDQAIDLRKTLPTSATTARRKIRSFPRLKKAVCPATAGP